jgi:hypothetical protein
MYMTSAKFIINDRKEIEYLSNLYRDISGRLTFCNGRTIIIDWIENPFFPTVRSP